MKKIYFLAAALGFASIGMAQNALPVSKRTISTAKPVQSATAPVYKALGVPIWEDDFDTPGDWVIDNDGITANAAGWNIDATNDSWAQALSGGINSTSGGNYAEVGNGDDPAAVAATEVTYTLTMANPIDVVALGGSQFVNLEFEQFGALFNDDQSFQISEDGTNFVTVGDNSDKEVLSANGGSAYDNPDLVRINLGQYLSANPTSVWIRFQWTSAFPTNTTNNAWITYGWQIDDVKITTLADNDIRTNNLTFGSEGLFYYQIPELQIAPIDFSVIAENNGENPQTGVALEATETTGSGYVGTSPAVSIPVQDSDSLVVATAFTPSGQGNYNIDFAILNDATDDDPANNAMDSYSFDVGEFIYARDIGTATGSFSGSGLTPPVTVEPANLFDIYADDDLYGIDVTFGPTLAEGIEVYGTLYELDANGDFVFIGETEIFTTGANDAGTSETLVFPSEFTLTAGNTYLVSVSSFATDFSVATAGAVPDQTAFIYGDLGTGGVAWYFINSAPMVRMNFDPSLSVENNELSTIEVSQFPNPFANETTVNYSLQEASAVEYSVVDMAGNVITTGNEGNQTAGEHSFTIDGASFANGVYYLELTAGDNKVTRRLVVNK